MLCNVEQRAANDLNMYSYTDFKEYYHDGSADMMWASALRLSDVHLTPANPLASATLKEHASGMSQLSTSSMILWYLDLKAFLCIL